MYPRPRRATIDLGSTPSVHVRSIGSRRIYTTQKKSNKQNPAVSSTASPIPSRPTTPLSVTATQSGSLLTDIAKAQTKPARRTQSTVASTNSATKVAQELGETTTKSVGNTSRLRSAVTAASTDTTDSDAAQAGESKFARFKRRFSSRSSYGSQGISGVRRMLKEEAQKNKPTTEDNAEK